LKVAHGQLPEDELEQTMLGFFKHEFDVLICTTIVESGMDVPKANTIFIDQPHLMGLSQLYQLRGRVGRSKERAYCYLLLPKGRELEPDAAERLRILKDNSELGSGLRIAHYDLELRGSGNILGEDQSGHISAVGYELYMELLDQAVAELRGNTRKKDIDSEINLRIPALIPDTYIEDIRVRLSYYKAISLIQDESEFEKMEAELQDRFGSLPDQVKNLLGLALVRSVASKLGASDLSQGTKNIILTLTDQTPIKPELAIQLSMRENKKYQLLPNNRFAIRINEVSWLRVYEELEALIRLAT
jgi:transcription-repair coupling factor (superfamily II helicase)